MGDQNVNDDETTGVFQVREIVRRHADHVGEHRYRDDLNRAQRQLHRALEQKSQAWKQGFRACVEMVAAGASLERLQEMCLEYAEEDTGPIALVV